MTQLLPVEIGERLVVQITDQRPMAFRVLEPVAFADSRELYELLIANSGIANGTVISVWEGEIGLALT